MSSILTNNSAMVALSTLSMVNKGLTETQTRVSTGLAIGSGKDNAAYFAISETMKGDSGMFKAINEGLTSTKNSVATARLGAETVKDLASDFSERVAFAQGQGIDLSEVQAELDSLVDQIGAAIDQATFNGEDLVSGAAATQTVVTGVTRSGGTFAATTITFQSVDLGAIQTALDAIDLTTSTDLAADLATAETQLGNAISAATSLGVTEKTVEGQQSFLDNLADTLDSGVSSMVDADMEQEAARLQALQVQQQLATQSLSIANQAPQNILTLFR
ncbi:flagellin N-terminal helical domain-containing protein [Cognatishimia activa]|uniref:Flagellin n=1 Tax=Cognatishimia activa TaxID=1715691 RepID=A0A0P1IQL3_9RHOB|nr:flagellin [Cognatishimia activa]CUI96083.1 Flagellin [Cognatishimia activa]CUK25876.1 Flagellin [Cognatishimia activa]